MVKVSTCTTYCWNVLSPKNSILHVFKITGLCMVMYRKSAKSSRFTTSCSVWGMTPIADIVRGKVQTTYTCHCCFTLMFNSAFSHVFGTSSLQTTWICTSLTWFWTISIIIPNKIYYAMVWKHAVFTFRWTLNLVCWHQLNKLFKWFSQRVYVRVVMRGSIIG